MKNAFAGCHNLTYMTQQRPNLVNVKDMSGMFAYAWNFNQNIGNWDVSSVENVANMFEDANNFNQDIGNWDVSSVKNMASMFYRAYRFNQDIGNWNVSSVTDMAAMLSNAHKFNQDIGNWDVSSVTDMGSMFYLGIDFDQDISNWDVSLVRDMDGMFQDASLSTSNYDRLLIKWSTLALQLGVRFHAGGSMYSLDAQAERQYLIDQFGWRITDGGLFWLPESPEEQIRDLDDRFPPFSFP